ncbi:MAG: hypothetical protein ABSD38_39080 [Syntrophorhabdales bacterium]
MAGLDQEFFKECQPYLPWRFRQAPPQAGERPLQAIQCLLMFPSPEEGLTHLPVKGGPLDGIPLVSEHTGVGLKGLFVVGKGLGIGGDPACLVSCLEEILLGLLPLFCFGIVVGKDAGELFQPVGEEGFYGRSDFSMKLMTFFQEDALVRRFLDEGSSVSP